MHKFLRTVAAVLTLIMVLGMVPFGVFAEETATETASESQYILYEENFDSYEGRFDLNAGNNYLGAGAGWIYSKKSDNGYAYIEDGKLYFSGSAYDVLYRDGGEVWGNYTVEADITLNSDNAGWVGLAYNVQSDVKLQKASVTTAGAVSLNGYDKAYTGIGSGVWTNNDSTLNKTTLTNAGLTTAFVSSQMRFKVSVENTSATLWLAQYTDGVLGSWTEVIAMDNMYEDAQTGSIGFMTSNGSLGSVIIDNIKVYSDSLVSFTEDFDAYEGTNLTAGENNSVNGGIGMYFYQGNNKAPAYVQDGKLYLDASSVNANYEHVYFNAGLNWTDYTVEMDIGMSADWIGMIYRATGPSFFQKAGVDISGRATLYGYTAPGVWKHNGADNKVTPCGVTVVANETFRMKVEVTGQSAKLYAAKYNEDGSLGAYTQVLSADNLYEEHTTGSVGLMLKSGSKLKAWIDNVVVSRGPDRMATSDTQQYLVSYVADGKTVYACAVNSGESVANVPTVPEKENYVGAWDHDGTNITADTTINAVYTEREYNVADIYIPTTGIVNPPTVIQQVTDQLPAATGKTAAVAMMEIDENLNIGTTGATVAEYFATYKSITIPAFVIDSQAEADAISSYLNENGIIDAFVVADSENAALVKAVRKACPNVRGAIRFDSVADTSAVLRTINENLAYVAISNAPVTVDTVSFFHLRQRALWCVAEDDADVYASIAAGWSGIISADSAAVYDVYEGITARTVTGQALPIGHRGFATSVPENTLAAFHAAMEQGCLAVETDLRISADGEIFLLHNNTLDYATDYENRTDVFTKGNVGSSYTIEELKQLNVDYKGGTYQIPTFEEALAEFADTGLVFFAHINGDDTQDQQITARLQELLEQYDAYDNVVFFIGSGQHSTLNPVDETVTGLISFTAGDEPELYASSSALACVESFITDLVPDNYQPIFYSYGEHDDWDFYYQLSARGFVNFHSVSNTMSYLEGIMLTDWGVIGALTDGANLTRDYVYEIQVSHSNILVGQTIDTTYDLSKAVGVTEQAACEFIQLSGTQIVNNTMTQPGVAEVVFYTTVTSTTGAQYRVYSQPVTITAAEGVDVVDWELALADELKPVFYLSMTEGAVDKTQIHVSVGGGEAVTYTPSQLEKTEAGLYQVNVALAYAQMADEIKLEIVIEGQDSVTKTYTVVQLAQEILADENRSGQHNLVRQMLNYGGNAQLYFGHNTGNLANADVQIEYPDQIPSETLEIQQEGQVSGIYFCGASLLHQSKLAVRFYFAANGVDGVSFQVGETAYEAKYKDGMYYVDVTSIDPTDYADVITLVVSDGTETMRIGYSPMHYITRMYNHSGTSQEMKNLLTAMYGFYLATDSTSYTVSTGAMLLLNSGYETSDKYAVLTGNIEALGELTYGWKNTVSLGVSGNIAWNNYGFQLAYGDSAEQNLVKLNNNMGYNGTDVVQEQWYNNAKLEALFSDGGMDIKLIRMNTRAFLLADMGDGYELIGTMMVPADEPTLFSACNNSTAVKLSNIQVETGKEATLTALNGIDLTLSKTPHIFPVDSDTWTVEGRLAVDYTTMPTSDYRLFAGADGFSQAVAVLAVGGSTTNWRVQNQTTWSSYVMADTYYNLLNKDNGGMWVRWIRSGDMLTLWVSADGKNWQQTQSFTGFTNDDLYILANQNLGAQLLDASFTTKAVFTQQKKANTMFIPADYTDANYAVFEGNIKALDAITYDWSSNLVVSVSGNAKWDKYDFQILYGTSASRNLVKLTNSTAGTFDGITVTQDQNINDPAFEKPFTDEGMNIKVVRLDTWAYLLADMGSGYELVGKMYIPADQATQFGVYNNNTAIEISNYSVKTGQDAALAALDGITLDVGLVANSFAVPVTTTQWTLEGKVQISDFAVTDDYRLFVSSLKSEWRRMSLAYIYTQTTWKGQSVAQVSGSWTSAVIPSGDNLTGDGLWTRWVRDGASLTLYVSTDRQTWTAVQACDNCGDANSIIYIFESAEQNSKITDLTIRTGLPT